MATPHREQLAKQLLEAQVGLTESQLQASKPTHSKPKRATQGSARPTRRHKISRHLPSPTEEQLERREQGWNDRFTRDSTPTQPKRPVRARRATDDNQDQKERKIREERQQYGNRDPTKHNRAGRLQPLASLAHPPQEPETSSSTEEKMRFKVLKAIDSRETLIYQLNALILCTPVQEALVMAVPRLSSGIPPPIKPRAIMALAPSIAPPNHANGSAMSNAREAMRLAQQLVADLQVAGIQVVEGIVEWMLEAGAKANKPPQFIWRGRNYFTKMQNDLDFAGPELHARGVQLDCFYDANPLCIRPDQKLGRVLAAQAIIKEMVELARQEPQASETTSVDQPLQSSGRGTRPNASQRDTLTEVGTEMDKPNGTPVVQHQVSADEMIANNDDYEDDGFASSRSNPTESTKTMLNLPIHSLRDVEADELVSILDESFCDVSAKPKEQPAQDSLPISGRSVKSSARDEYETSFDEENNQPQGEAEAGAELLDHTDIDQTQKAIVPISVIDDLPLKSDESDDLGNQAASTISDKSICDDVSVWDRAANQVSASFPMMGEMSGDELRTLSTWIARGREDLRAAMQKLSWGSVQSALKGSLLHFVSTLVSEKESLTKLATSLVSANDLLDVQLAELLQIECKVIVDELCDGLARGLELELKHISPLVSEVEFSDVMDATEKFLHDEDIRGAVRSVYHATEIMRASIHFHEKHPVSSGLSKMIKVFYPYLVNQRSDKLVDSWRRIAQLFIDSCGMHIDRLAFLLDPPCKTLLLNIEHLRRISAEEDGDNSASVPKLTIVCDRRNVLDSSVEVVVKKCFTDHDDTSHMPSYQIFPFFCSPFGEKIVDGMCVEEGEGKGPLKEWFTLIATDLSSKWSQVDLPLDISDDFDPVLVNGNKLVVDRLSNHLKSGYQVQWRSPVDGTTVSRIINSCDTPHGAYMLDRGGISNQSFSASELHVFQPRTAYLDYIQASESYWLNERLEDIAVNHRVIEFVGWFFANALIHQCALQLRLHPLLFDLLLDCRRIVTLQDVRSLDPSLHTAMEQLQKMKPAEFASYVEFEGLSPQLNVEEYTRQTIDEKYGEQSNIAWQVQHMRRGFHRVFSSSDLHSCGISAIDITTQLCGDNQDIAGKDFDVAEAFVVSLDPDFAGCKPLRSNFWKAVNGFEPTLKRKLVKFITGVDTLPQAGTEFLRIEMPFPAVSPAECEKTLRMLPQSHTCDNTLELPHYWRALCWKSKHDADQPNERLEADLEALIAEKLRLAAEYSSGYGLDGTKAAGNSLAGILPGTIAARSGAESSGEQLDIQDSYESLNLPGLGGDSIEEGGESRSAAPTQVGEPLSLETTDMRQCNDASGAKLDDATGTDAQAEEEYGADDWDVEEEVAE